MTASPGTSGRGQVTEVFGVQEPLLEGALGHRQQEEEHRGQEEPVDAAQQDH